MLELPANSYVGTFSEKEEGFVPLYGSLPLEYTPNTSRKDYVELWEKLRKYNESLIISEAELEGQKCIHLEVYRRVFFDAAWELDVIKIEELLKIESALQYINVQGHRGLTALHVLAAYGCAETVMLMASCPRCDVLMRDVNGKRASDRAEDEGQHALAWSLRNIERKREQQAIVSKRHLRLIIDNPDPE